jgi:Leucine-rich repeat (LRR) protein
MINKSNLMPLLLVEKFLVLIFACCFVCCRSTVPDALVSGLPQLQVCDVSDNKITALPALPSLPELTDLVSL